MPVQDIITEGIVKGIHCSSYKWVVAESCAKVLVFFPSFFLPFFPFLLNFIRWMWRMTLKEKIKVRGWCSRCFLYTFVKAGGCDLSEWIVLVSWTWSQGWIVSGKELQTDLPSITEYKMERLDEFSLSCVSWGKMTSKVNWHDARKDLVSWKS